LGGILGAAGAAVPGFIDWLSITGPVTKRLANWHARLNVIALLVFILDFYLRTTSGAKWIGRGLTVPLALSVLGIILITISGWLAVSLIFSDANSLCQRESSFVNCAAHDHAVHTARLGLL
jgi:predicted membrane protein DUF2231